MNKFKTLLLAHPVIHSDATEIAVKQLTDNVAKRTDGRITIANVLNSTVGTMPALIRMVIDGTADMALSTNDRLGIYTRKFDCINMPFVFDDHTHADRVLDGEFTDWVLPDLEKVGLAYLGSWEWGFRQFSNSRRPILRPEDVHGLKIRVPLIAQYRDAVLAFGGIPVWVEYSQLENIIRQGLLDGQENPVAIIYALRLQHVQKYLSLLDYSYGTLVHIVNKERLERLSAEQQVILREESRNAGHLMRRLARSQESSQLAEFAQQGIQIDRPDTTPFRAFMEPVWHGLCASFGDENVHAFLDLVDRQRKAPEPVSP